MHIRRMTTAAVVVALALGGLAAPSAASALPASRISARLSVDKPVAGSVHTLRVTVKSSGKVTGGTVTITYSRGYSRVTRTAVVSSRGTASFRVTALAKGKHRIALAFRKSSGAAASAGAFVYTSRAAKPAVLVGHVRDADTGEPVEHLRVIGTTQDGVGSDVSAHPSSTGRFSMSVAPGRYAFATSINARTGYLSSGGGKLLTLKPGHRYRIDFAVELGAILEGTVTDVSGRPLVGAHVEVVDATSGAAVSTVTAEEGGVFAFSGSSEWPQRLPAGTYLVRATAESGGTIGWFPNTSSADAATSVSLARGGRTQIRIVLPSG